MMNSGGLKMSNSGGHHFFQVSNKKYLGCLGYARDYTTQLYWIIISNYKGPF